MSPPLRWGILGTGGIARAFAQGLRDTPGAQLAAVGSRSQDKADAFAREFGAAAHGSYQALVEADVDIVYVATPHPMHARDALLALAAGKPVLVEKPFAMNAREAASVIEAARARNLFAMEAMWTRFLPALAALRRIIKEGAIGTPALLQADFGFAATLDPAHRLNQRLLGGGALLDLGIYPLSIARALLGPVAELQAQAMMGESGVDMSTVFTLRHADGALSYCSCSLRAASPCELTVSGPLGSVRLESMFHLAQALTVRGSDGSVQRVQAPFLGNGYVHEALAVGEALRQGWCEHPLMPHAETLAQMRDLDALRARIDLRYPADD